MKKLIALLVMAVAASANAATFGSAVKSASGVSSAPLTYVEGPLSFEGSVTATSNLVDGAKTLSDKRPTVYVEGDARLATTVGTFGIEVSSAKIYDSKVNIRNDLFVSYGTNYNGVDLIAKVGTTRFGGVKVESPTSERLILGAAYNGFFVAVDKTFINRANTGFDLSETVGYTSKVNDKLVVTGLVEFNDYQKQDVTKYKFAEVDATYIVNDRVSVGVNAVFLIKQQSGARQTPAFGVNASYKF